MATHARQQYFADERSLSKENREFSIADDIQQKIDNIEPGAQVNKIETVKVNGTALVPDANKAVNVEVPEVIDNLYTVDPDNALSAKQGKLLYDYIQNIASRGRFLSNWNSATGLPVTNPTENPYPYKAGDYYSVSNVAGSGGTNYRPDGSSYTIGQASTTIETEEVNVSDFYLYDGTNWLLLVNTARQIAVDSSLSTTSTNPVENRVVTNAINGKQNTLTAGNYIDITSNIISATGLQEELTAGNNVNIIKICESDMKGPCPSGFHVPHHTEWETLVSTFRNFNLGAISTVISTYLKLPNNYGMRKQSNNGDWTDVGGVWHQYYHASDCSWRNRYTFEFYNAYNISIEASSDPRTYPIRPFKNIPVIPDNTWTVLYDASSLAAGAGIFHNTIDGLISFSSDGTTWTTIADKNLGATTIWNYGDTATETNSGLVYQWGNN